MRTTQTGCAESSVTPASFRGGSVAGAASTLQNCPASRAAELVRPRLQRLASRPAVSGSPMTPWNWPSFRAAQPPETWIRQHRAYATVPGNTVTRHKSRCGGADGVGMGDHLRLRCSFVRACASPLLSGTFTQHTLWMTLRTFIPGAQGTPRPCAGINVPQSGVRCSPAASLSRRVLSGPRIRPGTHPRQLAGIPHANPVAPP